MPFGPKKKKKSQNQRKLKAENKKWKKMIAMNILHFNHRITGPLRSFPTKSNLWISFTCHCEGNILPLTKVRKAVEFHRQMKAIHSVKIKINFASFR